MLVSLQTLMSEHLIITQLSHLVQNVLIDRNLLPTNDDSRWCFLLEKFVKIMSSNIL